MSKEKRGREAEGKESEAIANPFTRMARLVVRFGNVTQTVSPACILPGERTHLAHGRLTKQNERAKASGSE